MIEQEKHNFPITGMKFQIIQDTTMQDFLDLRIAKIL